MCCLTNFKQICGRARYYIRVREMIQVFTAETNKFPALCEDIKECGLASCKVADNISGIIFSLTSMTGMQECVRSLKEIADDLWDTGNLVTALSAAAERIAEAYSLHEMRIAENAEYSNVHLSEDAGVGSVDISSASPMNYDIKIGLS